MDIAIVTDSTADIPLSLAGDLKINVVPNLIFMDGKNLEDNVDISREEFYQRLPQMNPMPTTGTASPGVYHNLYEKLFQQGFNHILSIHASGLLSGILNAASNAAQAFEGRVTVFDSGQVTLGLGFQVLAAAEDVVHGLQPEQIVRRLSDMRNRVRVIAMLDTLEYIRRSGRVSWAKAQLGALLQIKPFIELRDGKVSSLGEVRTRRKGIERLHNLLKGLGELERLGVLHTNAEAEAQQVIETLKLGHPQPELMVNVTTVIGAHVGPGALGFAVVTR
ncbi:MAG: DegV family protein [Chloroflexota bacterium]|nr:MAG: DegV family protein [Chloroflexota bacterium]